MGGCDRFAHGLSRGPLGVFTADRIGSLLLSTAESRAFASRRDAEHICLLPLAAGLEELVAKNFRGGCSGDSDGRLSLRHVSACHSLQFIKRMADESHKPLSVLFAVRANMVSLVSGQSDRTRDVRRIADGLRCGCVHRTNLAAVLYDWFQVTEKQSLVCGRLCGHMDAAVVVGEEYGRSRATVVFRHAVGRDRGRSAAILEH